MPYSANQVAKLQAERTNDPHGRTYLGMDDATFLASVNLADVAVLREDVTTQEIFEAYVGSELPVRGSDQWENLMLLGAMNNGSDLSMSGNIQTVLEDVFGIATTTRANLLALKDRNDSPAKIAGLPPPSLGDVQRTS